AIARQGEGRMKVVGNGKNKSHALYGQDDPIAAMPATEKVALLGRVETIARAKDPHVIQVMAGLGSAYDVVMIVGSDGRLAADIRPLVRLSVTVIVERNGRREMGHGGGGGRLGLNYFSDALLH